MKNDEFIPQWANNYLFYEFRGPVMRSVNTDKPSKKPKCFLHK